MFTIRNGLAFSTTIATLALSAGCQPIFAPPELTVELRFVADHEGAFSQRSSETTEIGLGEEIGPSLLSGCWGSFTRSSVDLDAAAGTDTGAHSLLDALGFGGVVLHAEEIEAFVFDAQRSQMEWHLYGSDVYSLAPLMEYYVGSFQMREGNLLHFEPDQLEFSDPSDGELVVYDSRGRVFEWLISVDGDSLRLQGQGDLASDPDNGIDRDEFVFHRFDCP